VRELVELAHVSAKQLYHSMSAKHIDTAGSIIGRSNKLGHDTTAAGSFKHHPVWSEHPTESPRSIRGAQGGVKTTSEKQTHTWALMGRRGDRHLGRQKGYQPVREASGVCHWDVDEIA
jgi:hypothetical protein